MEIAATSRVRQSMHPRCLDEVIDATLLHLAHRVLDQTDIVYKSDMLAPSDIFC